VIDHEETRGQAGDDLLAESFRGFGARFHRALLDAKALQRVLQRARHQRRLAAFVAALPADIACRDAEFDEGIGDDRREGRDNGREAEEEQAGVGHA
jgi:hypothetical protein